jgi:O-Antigen ligase
MTAKPLPQESLFRLENMCLVLWGCLLSLSCLIANDAPAITGSFILQAALWLILACLMTWYVYKTPQQFSQWDALDSLALAWLLWNLFLVTQLYNVGDVRAGWNGAWQNGCLSLAFLMGRRILHTTQLQQTALQGILILSCIVAMWGLYQYTFIFPEIRRLATENPQRLLRENNLSEDLQDAKSALFLSRVHSKEPIACFALTNTLAGFLLPSLILLLGQFTTLFKQRATWQQWFFIGMVFFGILLCFLLTKSRSAWLAFTLVAMLALVWQRVHSFWLFGSGSLVLMVGLLIAWAAGGLDQQVWSEAPVSVLYRLQYWKSSFSMLQDHWLFGVGPGNFQSVYPLYKLPEASETIADPHNWLLEIATTTGCIGLSIIMLWGMVFIRNMRSVSLLPTFTNTTIKSHWLLSFGIMLGLFCLPVVFQLNGLNTQSILGIPFPWVGLVLFVVLQKLFQKWGNSEISPAYIGWGVIALLINFLAAGGISFPCLGIVLVTLLAVLTANLIDLPSASQEQPRQQIMPFLGAIALLGIYLFTTYFPVLNARSAQLAAENALTTGNIATAQTFMNTACLADPYDSNVAFFAASLIDDTGAFREAVLRAIQCNNRAAKNHEQAGDLLWMRANTKKDQILYHDAILAYTAAIERYPKSNQLHAKLAWAAYKLKKFPLAKQHAQSALELNSHTPHKELQLENGTFTLPGMQDSSTKTKAACMQEILQQAGQ